MNTSPILEIKDMPFCLGAMQCSSNPCDLPNVYQFRLQINHDLARLEQAEDQALKSILNRAYMVGAEMGTPSDSTDLGKPYVADFLNFIHKFVPVGGQLLEIGAGTGFLSRCLRDAGWHVTSLEPGQGYVHHWNRHGISVINDFFPSSKITGKFDAIVFYTVLEHIKDTQGFLKSVKAHLNFNGKIFVGVPDCTLELYTGDLSILLHEHYQYFTVSSLANTLLNAGFHPQVEKSKYGRSLFAVGSISEVQRDKEIIDKSEIDMIQHYLKDVVSVRKTVRAMFDIWEESGSLGIYCPSRILNYLDSDSQYVFYDDAVGIQGRYYPPFSTTVLSRKQLFAKPPKNLLIASITFGERLKQELIEQGLISKIYTLKDLFK
jgi:2-polyprenyl-3-methyl-5-hydroxy-6-metoxy-1,4-benzoquinol methylase